MRRLSIRTGNFETGNDSFGDEVEVVVVNAAPVSRAFYQNSFDSNSFQKPVCWSTDTQQPHSSVLLENKQAHRCIDCSQNVRGSSSSGGRACRFSQKIAVMFEDGLDTVYQIQVPANSIFGKAKGKNMPLQEYAKFLNGRGTSAESIYTRIFFDKNSMVPKLYFAPNRPLQEREVAQVVSMISHKNTIGAITTDYSTDYTFNFSSEENTMNHQIKGVEALWPKLDQPYYFDKAANRSQPCDAKTDGAEFCIDLKIPYSEAIKLRKEMKAFYEENAEESWGEFDDRFTIIEGSKKEKNAVFKTQCKVKAAYNDRPTPKPKQYKANLEPLPEDFQLTTGSTVNIEVGFYAWSNPAMGSGVSLRPRAVQVIALAEKVVSNSFTAQEGYGSEEGEEGHSFTAVGDTPAKVDEEPDEPEEPKAIVKSKKAPPKEDSLDDLIDEWDE